MNPEAPPISVSAARILRNGDEENDVKGRTRGAAGESGAGRMHARTHARGTRDGRVMRTRVHAKVKITNVGYHLTPT